MVFLHFQRRDNDCRNLPAAASCRLLGPMALHARQNRVKTQLRHLSDAHLHPRFHAAMDRAPLLNPPGHPPRRHRHLHRLHPRYAPHLPPTLLKVDNRVKLFYFFRTKEPISQSITRPY